MLLVFGNVCRNYDFRTAFLQMFDSIDNTFIVYAESIDYGFVARNSPASWLWVSILRLWSKRAYLYETEAEISHFIVKLTVLVQSSSQSYRIWKVDTKYFFRQFRGFPMVNETYNGLCKRDMSQKCEHLEKHVVGSFRIESEKNWFKNMLVHDKN